MTSPSQLPAPTMASEFLSPKKVAALLGVSTATVYRLVEQRLLPFYRIGGSLRFASDDLQQFLAQQRVTRLV